ncbi:hypothetical protein NDU88_005340 [Pleurodeles waltl]|uniref:Uncharacterized protein n=1 Tax=Pleurodeles waltl TaxID=8319 RepID=A0AAV7TV91_PLEWA|nr:hypothetical protein NDU88_005340 [Pleurodeles waltl]
MPCHDSLAAPFCLHLAPGAPTMAVYQPARGPLSETEERRSASSEVQEFWLEAAPVPLLLYLNNKRRTHAARAGQSLPVQSETLELSTTEPTAAQERHLHLSGGQGEERDEVSEERPRAEETERVKQNLVVPIGEEPAPES